MRPIAIHQPSPEFVRAVNTALDFARRSTDEAAAYAAHVVPVLAQRVPDEQQYKASRANGRMLLGLWVDRWPGIPSAPHGTVFIFEEGIRAMGGDLVQESYKTIMHELDHALQRDHVLEALQAERAAAHAVRVAAHVDPRGCGPCGH